MTSQKQKNKVKFCEDVLRIEFQGDIDSYKQVTEFLNDNYDRAKEIYQEAFNNTSY